MTTTIFELPTTGGYEHLKRATAYSDQINKEATLGIEDLVVPEDLPTQATNLIQRGLRDLRNDRGEPYEKIFVELSGGIDSAVGLKLACDTVGSEKVMVVHYKHRNKPISTERTDTQNADYLIHKFAIPEINIVRSDVSDLILNCEKIVLQDENTKVKTQPVEYCDAAVWARSTISKLLEMRYNALSIDTSCLTEDLLGHFTTGNKRGHIGVGERLLKTEVRNLGRLLKLPERIVQQEKISGEVGSTFATTWGVDESVLDPIMIGYLYADDGHKEALVEMLHKSLGHGKDWLSIVVDKLLMLPATRYNTGEPTLKVGIHGNDKYGDILDLDKMYFSYRNTLPSEEKQSTLLTKLKENRKGVTEKWFRW